MKIIQQSDYVAFIKNTAKDYDLRITTVDALYTASDDNSDFYDRLESEIQAEE